MWCFRAAAWIYIGREEERRARRYRGRSSTTRLPHVQERDDESLGCQARHGSPKRAGLCTVTNYAGFRRDLPRAIRKKSALIMPRCNT